jgi:hypothetical protein
VASQIHLCLQGPQLLVLYHLQQTSQLVTAHSRTSHFSGFVFTVKKITKYTLEKLEKGRRTGRTAKRAKRSCNAVLFPTVVEQFLPTLERSLQIRLQPLAQKHLILCNLLPPLRQQLFRIHRTTPFGGHRGALLSNVCH